MYLELSQKDSELYFIQNYDELLKIADLIEELGLNLELQYTFASIPALRQLEGKYRNWLY